MSDPFLDWWIEYSAKLHQTRVERQLHPIPYSVMIHMIEAARAAWEASDAGYVQGQKDMIVSFDDALEASGHPMKNRLS
jgi:hypothetical protein